MQIADHARRTVTDMRALVDFAFWRLIMLVLILISAVWLAAFTYRLVVRRIGQRAPDMADRDRP